MAAKTRKAVDFERPAAALPEFPFAYLITVDDDYRAHTVAVEPVLRELAVLDVGLIGGGTRTNLETRRGVTLVWPPTEPGGYSLIADGVAEAGGPGRLGRRALCGAAHPRVAAPQRRQPGRRQGLPARLRGVLAAKRLR